MVKAWSYKLAYFLFDTTSELASLVPGEGPKLWPSMFLFKTTSDLMSLVPGEGLKLQISVFLFNTTSELASLVPGEGPKLWPGMFLFKTTSELTSLIPGEEPKLWTSVYNFYLIQLLKQIRWFPGNHCSCHLACLYSMWRAADDVMHCHFKSFAQWACANFRSRGGATV